MAHATKGHRREKPRHGVSPHEAHALQADFLWWAVSGAGVAGVLLVMFATSKYGVGLSPDSANYLCSARSLLLGQGLVCADGEPLVSWPPLYPTLLALLGLGGVDPWDGARIVNAFAHGLSVFVTGLMLARTVRSRILTAAGILAVLVMPSLLSTSTMAWTEPLFTLLVLLIALTLLRYLERRTAVDFVLLCAVTILACYQRYIGVSLILSVSAVVAAVPKETPQPQRARDAVMFFGVSSAAVLPWLLRNYSLTGTLAGARPDTLQAEGTVVVELLSAAFGWFLPSTVVNVRRWFPILLGLAAVAGYIAVVKYTRSDGTKRHGLLMPAIAVTESVYALALVGSVSLSAISQVPRFMTPMFPLLVIGGIVASESLLRRLQARIVLARALFWCLATLWAVWIVWWSGNSVALVAEWIRFGAGGYNTVTWRRSPTVAWLRENPPDGRILCNAPDALHLLTGIPSSMSPRRTDPPSTTRDVLSRDDGWLVWFRQAYRPYLNSPDELARYVRLTPLARFPDGEVMRIQSPHGSSAPGGRSGDTIRDY